MIYGGIILAGTSGSGKTTITRELCQRDTRFAQVKAVTTRPQRADDHGEYDYISTEEFLTAKDQDDLMIQAEYRGHYYGIRHSDFSAIRDEGRVPILTITPDSAVQIDGMQDATPAQWKPPRFLSFFLDAPDSELDRRLQERGELIAAAQVMRRRQDDRTYSDRLLYFILNTRLDATLSLIVALWDCSNSQGVLSGRLIRLMLDCGMLLEHADPQNASGASYDLTLGEEYFYGGEIRRLSHERPILMIEPYDYAIVTSAETANFPRDICGRFDLAISLFAQGIILSNGPQVDPGFKGPLFCLLFNTSSSPVLVKRRQHYATIEFHKTVEPTYLYRGKYQSQDLLQYLPANAARGAINQLKQELESVRSDSQKLQNATWAILSLVLALIAIIIALR